MKVAALPFLSWSASSCSSALRTISTVGVEGERVKVVGVKESIRADDVWSVRNC